VRRLLIALLSLLSASVSAAPPAATGAEAAAARLSVADAAILGVVEGVTEFLPVSSTGHLIIANHLLGLDRDTPLKGPAGETLWHKRPSARNPAGEPLTLKLAADTYAVVIQAGAIAAVALLYWNSLLSMLNGLLGRDPAGRRLLVSVLIAFVPAAGLGFLAHGWIEAHLFSIGGVIAALVAGAVLMLWAEAWRRRRPVTDVAPAEITPARAAVIGALQCAALWPGTSRSMMTIVGGYLTGLDPRRAAEFSFLLGFVTLTAASVYKGYRSGGAMIEVFGWGSVILGGIVAAVTAAICVRFLVHWLTRHGLALFAWYRLALAAVLAAVTWL
jgi:undecaprenyl-diphosphatase